MDQELGRRLFGNEDPVGREIEPCLLLRVVQPGGILDPILGDEHPNLPCSNVPDFGSDIALASKPHGLLEQVQGAGARHRGAIYANQLSL